MDRSTPFGHIVKAGIAHFITRQVYTGAGKVGTELPGMNRDEVTFQLTQRADFFEEQVGLETTLKRPIINTRDEPHADVRKYRRLHVIAGDANMSEVSTFLKVGVTAIVLGMVEHDAISRQWIFTDPVRAMQQISLDLSLKQTLELETGERVRAIDVQDALCDDAARFLDKEGTDAVGGDVAFDVLARWRQVIDQLRDDPMQLSTSLDWVAKYQLLDAYRSRHDLAWNDARLCAMDIQYHDMRPERSLAKRLPLETLAAPALVAQAVTDPPDETRAYFRGECLRKWGDHIVAANWDSLVFDVGVDRLRRIPMLEPTRGTRQHVATVLEECETPLELIERIEGS